MTRLFQYKYAANARTALAYSRALFFLTVSAAVLTGCAGSAAFQRGVLQEQSQSHIIANVPFFPEKKNSCGPAALAGVISFWNGKADLRQIEADVYLPELRGTLPFDMERYMSQAGFKTTSFAGTLDELRARLREDIPVIALVDSGFSFYRLPHYVIVVGFDDKTGKVVTHDGVRDHTTVGYEKFMQEWGRAGYWMLVSVPHSPDKRDK